jgi:hypothetical protein
MIERTTEATVRGIDTRAEGTTIYGGIMADERPVAAALAQRYRHRRQHPPHADDARARVVRCAGGLIHPRSSAASR